MQVERKTQAWKALASNRPSCMAHRRGWCAGYGEQSRTVVLVTPCPDDHSRDEHSRDEQTVCAFPESLSLLSHHPARDPENLSVCLLSERPLYKSRL